ncbi:MAG: hypothetical protein Q4D38_05365 [Planctomycetia bacterium]|nr:hypothetical protein [Planctomycetia bacterium]
MKSPFFLALGLFLILFGAQCLCVEKFVFKFERPAAEAQSDGKSDAKSPKTTAVLGAKKDTPADPCEFSPTQPMAWSIIAVGGFLILNTLTSGKS